MSRRFVRIMVAAGLAALVVAVCVSYVSDGHAGSETLAEPAVTKDLISRGRYLAQAGDCAACHSVEGKPPFSGGLRMSIPIGAIYTTNITPDPRYGIGRFTLTDFDRALRYGVAEHHTLYPAMPYTSYYNTKPEDVAALYAYFKHGVAAAPVPNHSSDVVFPLSMRWPLTFWRLLFAPRPAPFRAPPGASTELASGAYFVEGLGHCGECHTPRTPALSLQATTPADGKAFLSGAVIEGYFAPSLRNDTRGSLMDWSVEDIADFLKTGFNRQGAAFASMSDVIVHSTQYLTAGDAHATALYLKSLSAGNTPASVAYQYDPAEQTALRAGHADQPGAMVYLNNCAACHRPDGKGYEKVFPALAGNPIVLSPNPQSLVAIVLQGSHTPRTLDAPAQFTMPAFAWRLSDQDVSDVVTFVRTSWGNHAEAITPEVAAKARKRL